MNNSLLYITDYSPREDPYDEESQIHELITEGEEI